MTTASWKYRMTTGSQLAITIFVIVALAHLLRLLLQLDVTIDEWLVPQWVSAPGVLVPGLIAWLLWRER